MSNLFLLLFTFCHGESGDGHISSEHELLSHLGAGPPERHVIGGISCSLEPNVNEILLRTECPSNPKIIREALAIGQHSRLSVDLSGGVGGRKRRGSQIGGGGSVDDITEDDVAEVGGGGEVPDGEDLDLIPSDIVFETDSEGCAFESVVEFVVGDDEAGGEVVEIGGGGAPPVDVGAGEHVEIGDLEGAVVENFDGASQLVLQHFEFGFQVDQWACFRAIRTTRIAMAECEKEEEEDDDGGDGFGKRHMEIRIRSDRIVWRVWDPVSAVPLLL